MLNALFEIDKRLIFGALSGGPFIASQVQIRPSLQVVSKILNCLTKKPEFTHQKYHFKGHQDKGIGKKKSTKDKDAAKAVGTRSERSTPEGDESKSYIKESDVNRMTAQQYEARQEEIAEAIRTGKFIYDLSGSAR